MGFEILIIDSDKEFSHGLSVYFGMRSDFKFFAASTAKKGLEVLAQNNIHVVLVGDNLSDADGFKLTKQIKEAYPFAQVLMFTKSSSLEDKNRALACKADEFLTKPISVQELDLRLQAHLRIHELLCTLERTKKNFQSIVDTFSEPVFVFEKDLRIIYSNRYFKIHYKDIKSVNDFIEFFSNNLVDRFIEEANAFFNATDEKDYWIDFRIDYKYYQLKFLRFMDRDDRCLAVLLNPTLDAEIELFSNSSSEVTTRLIKQNNFLQERLCTHPLPLDKRVGFQTSLMAGSKSGADYFRLRQNNGKYYFLLSDILGEKSSVALPLAILSQLLKKYVDLLFADNLVDFFKKVELSILDLGFQFPVSLLVGILDTDTQELQFMAAGHHPPRFITLDGRSFNFPMSCWGVPLGLNCDKQGCEKHDYVVHKMDIKDIKKIAFFSDGMVEFKHLHGNDIDYQIIDRVLATSSYKGTEQFLAYHLGKDFQDDATLFTLNVRKVFKENIHIKSSVNIDLITERFMRKLDHFDYPERAQQQVFVVLQEVLSNMLKYGEGGLLRVAVNHRYSTFIFENQGPGFKVWEILEWVQKNMYKNDGFPVDMLNEAQLDSSHLGLYMTLQHADRFWASENGKYLGIIVRKPENTLDYRNPHKKREDLLIF